MIPNKLKPGSHIRIAAPARSFKIVTDETRKTALKRFSDLGLSVSYARHAEDVGLFMSTPAKSRVEDLMEAFADPSVDAIVSAVGGFNTNDILDYLDYDLIKKNPKIVCGFSDITALTSAIYAKTGLVTYSGPHFSSFGMAEGFDYTLEYFKKCLLDSEPFEVKPSNEWSNDLWFLNQKERSFLKNDGFFTINKGTEGVVEGTIIGGNIEVLNTLKGTPYFPKAENFILFIEHSELDILRFNCALQALLLVPGFKENLKGIVLGRFEKDLNVTPDLLFDIFRIRRELDNLPIAAGFDFGHTTPIFTFPVGGKARLTMTGDFPKLEILEH